MPAKIYKVTLTTEERAELEALVSRGTGNARRLRRARILLLADENQPEGAWRDADIAKALSAHARTVERTRENVWIWALKRHSTTRDLRRHGLKY